MYHIVKINHTLLKDLSNKCFLRLIEFSYYLNNCYSICVADDLQERTFHSSRLYCWSLPLHPTKHMIYLMLTIFFLILYLVYNTLRLVYDESKNSESNGWARRRRERKRIPRVKRIRAGLQDLNTTYTECWIHTLRYNVTTLIVGCCKSLWENSRQYLLFSTVESSSVHTSILPSAYYNRDHNSESGI